MQQQPSNNLALKRRSNEPRGWCCFWELYERGLRVIPGGVNSPVRAFGAVGGVPVVFERGEGAYLEDVDGRRFLDFVMSWGAIILGHAHSLIAREVERAARRGTSFGADGELWNRSRHECHPTFACLYTALKDLEVQGLLSRSR